MMGGKYKSVYVLKERVSELVEAGDLDRALALIHDFVERIITEPVCTSQVFGSKELDRLCQHIGEENFIAIRREVADTPPSQNNQPLICYIVTKLQKSGGHTRVIADFIKVRPEARHVLFSTELEGKSDADYLTNGSTRPDNLAIELAPKGSYHRKLTWLQKRLVQSRPVKVYLFNHHQDSVAASAIVPEMGFDGSFYHHGDHHLCLGVYLSHLDHIDSHPMGYDNCRDVLGISNSYIPLTVDDKGNRPLKWPFLSDGMLTTCTAARSNKIEMPYFVSYLDVVPQLIKATGGRHIHIGRLTPWALFNIRRGMKRLGIQPERFIYTPWVPSVWKTLHDFRVDLYISSFPHGGGLTLIEAMGAGVPVVLHRHLFSRVLSVIDLAYPEAFCWRYPEELIDYCSRLQPENLEEQSILGRRQYERFHKWEIFNDAVADPRKRIAPSNLPTSFSPQTDEWACWMENQLSWVRLASRGFYRLFKKIRADFF
jgi:hypothetical protein